MAGKSSKGRNRKGSNSAQNSSESAVQSDVPDKDTLTCVEPVKSDANGVPEKDESIGAKPEVKESEADNSRSQTKQGKNCCDFYFIFY